MRIGLDKKRNCTRFPEGRFVGYRRFLRDADVLCERLLFNHLAYLAMRCSDQGSVTLNQLLESSIETGIQASVQQVARYQDPALV
jgi:hypothetical protein